MLNIPSNIILKIVNNLDIKNIINIMLVSKYYYNIIEPLKRYKINQTCDKYLDSYYSEILLNYINDKLNFNNIDNIHITFFPVVMYELKTRILMKNFIKDVIFKKYMYTNPEFLSFLNYEWNINIPDRIKQYIITYRTVNKIHDNNLLDEMYSIEQLYFGEKFNNIIRFL